MRELDDLARLTAAAESGADAARLAGAAVLMLLVIRGPLRRATPMQPGMAIRCQR